MPGGRKTRSRKQWLYRRQGGRCFWCAVTMVLPRQHVHEPPDNLATLDHLDDRLSGRRGMYAYGVERTVLACRKCNNERGRQSELQMPIEELRKRCGSYPSVTAMKLRAAGLDAWDSVDDPEALIAAMR